ncbi:MAG TPA: DUF402 domain-containing protein [Pelolinea sp.]|nr:DUF402 domain-containing protein [Pelolinea sp.]
MNQKITIVKNNHRGEEVWQYEGKIIANTSKGLIAEAFFNRTDLEFNGILLKEGDRFLEVYLFEQWFNVYEIYDRDDGSLKAWYCNVTRPIRTNGNQLSYDDLALDLLVYPDGNQLVLDEDEFLILEITGEERHLARSALNDLQNLFMNYKSFDIRQLI